MTVDENGERPVLWTIHTGNVSDFHIFISSEQTRHSSEVGCLEVSKENSVQFTMVTGANTTRLWPGHPIKERVVFNDWQSANFCCFLFYSMVVNDDQKYH